MTENEIRRNLTRQAIRGRATDPQRRLYVVGVNR